MAAHALLSPSSAHRWLNCVPSARLEAQYPDSSSEAAAEGTFAHRMCELSLKKSIAQEKNNPQAVKAFEDTIESLKSDNFYSPALMEYAQDYVDRVLEKLAEARASDPEAELWVERKFNLKAWVPGGFGTSDAVIESHGTLEVIDFKYGKNVVVSADHNPQLMLYALGVLQYCDWDNEIETVTTTIIQPRAGGESSFTYTMQELQEFAETVKAGAALAYKGEGKPCPGNWCQFCKASVKCRALAEKYTTPLKTSAKPAELNEAEMTAVLSIAAGAIKWLNSVTAYAQDQALKGVKWEGFKLVEGRSIRKIADEVKAMNLLYEAGYDQEDFMTEPSLQTITNLEKQIGKKKLTEILGDCIVKPQGKPTLVPESDKRPEFNSAASDFVEIPF